MLEIRNLKVKVDGTMVLNGLNLVLPAGEVHAVMGPNGSGKSTLAKALSGAPGYEIVDGEVLFNINLKLQNLLELSVEDRAREGLFLGFQYPVEVPGVTNLTFLKASFDAVCKHHGVKEMSSSEFEVFVLAKAKEMEINPSFLNRGLNEGFSGGEKKRNEILQMSVLNPRVAILDEIDSGLDIDSLKVVAAGVNRLRKRDKSFLLITHYQRLLDHIVPDRIHVLANGLIRCSGGREMALALESKGYDWVLQNHDAALAGV